MYFLTEKDPDYTIKGSRDPLGFQSIWQKLGRKIIKDLSTVSVSITDFQVMSFAWYFWADRSDKNFMAFFYKFEQACAYSRELYFENSSYNGKDFVSKRKNDSSFRLSTNNADTILSNQKAYGVFGKYNRPFTEMRIKYQEDFKSVMESAINEKTNPSKLLELVKKLITEEVVSVTKKELKSIADLLYQLSEAEKQFYEKIILEAPTHKCQNELYQLFKTHPELLEGTFQLYPFIESLFKYDISDELKSSLVEIKNTERVLYSYAKLFRHLQSKHEWQLAELKQQELFSYFPEKQDYVFSDSIINQLNEELQHLKEDTSKIALSAVVRNEVVSKRRNNLPWIKQEKGKLVRYYSDGGREILKLDVNNEYENNYFIPTYISLFHQINPNR